MILLSLPVTLPGSLHALGFYHEPGWWVAERLIEKGKSADGCKRIFVVPWARGGPSATEQRIDCVLAYAEMTLDSSVCEKLLPSKYALDCLNEVDGKLFSGNHCYKRAHKNEVFCSSASLEGEITIQNPQIGDCSLYKRKDLKEWCFEMRSVQFKGVYECDKITSEVVRDNCEIEYAFNNKDPSICSKIKNAKRHKHCVIIMSMLQTHPELYQ